MIKEIEEVDGVKWVIGINSLIGSNFPDSMIPSDIKEMLKYNTAPIHPGAMRYYVDNGLLN